MGASRKGTMWLFGSTASVLACSAALAQPISSGEALFGLCSDCHAIGYGAKIKVGPPLNGVVGRPLGSYAGYIYSESMREAAESHEVWTEEKLERWLQNPRALVPFTKMMFPGLSRKQQRQGIIEFLKGFDALGNKIAK